MFILTRDNFINLLYFSYHNRFFLLKSEEFTVIIIIKEILSMNSNYIVSHIKHIQLKKLNFHATIPTEGIKTNSALYYIVEGELECVKNEKKITLDKNDFIFCDYGDKIEHKGTVLLCAYLFLTIAKDIPVNLLICRIDKPFLFSFFINLSRSF